MVKVQSIKPSNIKKIKRWILILLATFILFIFGVFVLFILNKDSISSKVILASNNYSQGELSFDNITFSPLVQFPNISITLENAKYYEQKKHDSLAVPITHIQYLHGGINIFKLLKGKIEISSVLVENGKINLITYADSSTNISNALKHSYQDSSKNIQLTDTIRSTQSDSLDTNNFALLLSQLQLNNIALNYINHIAKNKSSITINEFSSYLNLNIDSSYVSLQSNIELVNIPLDKSLAIKNLTLDINTSLHYKRRENSLILDNCMLHIEDAMLKLSGSATMGEKKYIDIHFNGSDNDLSFFGLFLNKQGLDNIKKGGLYFKGRVNGAFTADQIPRITSDFGITSMHIDIPESTESIKELTLKGRFNSGLQANLQHARLSIDTLSAILPDGYAQAKLELKDFATPYLEYIIDLETDLDGFTSILKIGSIKDIQGKIKLASKFSGNLSAGIQPNYKEKSYSILHFDSISFTLPQIMDFNNINGTISGNSDTLCIDNLNAKIGNSDFLINGNAYQIANLILNKDSSILADLSIESKLFDLAEFLHFIPEVGKGFPYQISDINLNVNVETSQERLFNSYPVPNITFDINTLSATVNKLIAPVLLSNGTFVLGDSLGDLLLTFDHFNAAFSGGELVVDVRYHEPENQDKYVAVSTEINDFNVGEFFFYGADSIPKLIDVPLNGIADCKIEFPSDANIMFSNIELNIDDLDYISDSTNINLKGLTINATNTYYNTSNFKNPLATLSSNIQIGIANFSANAFSTETIEYDIKVIDGEYTIKPMQTWLFGKPGNGIAILTPFKKPMQFYLEYEVESFDASILVNKFSNDSLVDGQLDFSMQLESSGNNFDEVFKKADGHVSISGNNLSLYGIDLDDFLKKIERSQNFNLVDLGAIMVAGPAGLALSKGTTITRLILTDKGSKTEIPEFISNLEINKGVYALKDVAFTTNNNRVAAIGSADYNTKALSLEFAVVNSKGCSKVSQKLRGTINKPKLGELKVISSLLAPVTNLIDDVVGGNCDPIYTGSIKHPKKQ